MKLLTRTKKEPYGVEMSVKEFLDLLKEDSVAVYPKVNGYSEVVFTADIDTFEFVDGKIRMTCHPSDTNDTFTEEA